MSIGGKNIRLVVGSITETGLPCLMVEDGPVVAELTKWIVLMGVSPERMANFMVEACNSYEAQSKEIEFNPQAKCDVCGAMGATDFYGDNLCPKCANTCAEDCASESSQDAVFKGESGALRFVEITPQTFKGKKVLCQCRFCQGGEMRPDVRHIKMFYPDGSEYWLHLDSKTGIAELKEKL